MKLTVYTRSLRLHAQARGKLQVKPLVPLKTQEDLSLAYTPGVAEPCRKIAQNPGKIYTYTRKWNTVAVVTDGSAVLGLGDIGAAAALPVMEGKAILFKEFGGVDAIPVCINTRDVSEIVRTVVLISPGFGGINLEDISSPRCFQIEELLKEQLSLPIFHDDQHGTAVVVLAGLLNALCLVGKKLSEVKIVVCGAGAAGIAIVRFLHRSGARKMILCDRQGIVYQGRPENMNPAKESVCEFLMNQRGTLAEALQKADVFIGVSAPGLVTSEMIKSMNKEAIVFAMSNPVPEIMPDEAKKAGAAVIGTGRSDLPNQINNLLAFPGIFRGALDARAPEITEKMKKAASQAIAGCVPRRKLSSDFIVPSPLDKKVAQAVARAVYQAAKE
ncbi:MAG: NADP-dependent malic enzyme [Candidatus Omnitrophica bacterium]|nr:NADP-dependent malic enzyme [Candidatus Omnitrophota bacterium]